MSLQVWFIWSGCGSVAFFQGESDLSSQLEEKQRIMTVGHVLKNMYHFLWAQSSLTTSQNKSDRKCDSCLLLNRTTLVHPVLMDSGSNFHPFTKYSADNRTKILLFLVVWTSQKWLYYFKCILRLISLVDLCFSCVVARNLTSIPLLITSGWIVAGLKISFIVLH